MKNAKHTFLLIPILMIVFHPVFINNAQAATQEQTCKKWQTKNANGQCIDSSEYKACTTGNLRRNSHWDEDTNTCVCNSSQEKWETGAGGGVCVSKQESAKPVNKKATRAKTATSATADTTTESKATQNTKDSKGKTCNILHAEKQYYDKDQKKCLVEPGGCELGYKANEKFTMCVVNKGGSCYPQEPDEPDSNAPQIGGYEFNAQAKCVLVKCNDGYKPKNNKCVVDKGGKCTPQTKVTNAASYEYNESAKCVVTECEKGYKVENNECVVDKGGKCTPQTKVTNAASYEYNESAKCVVTECEKGYKVEDNECISDDGKECTPTIRAKYSTSYKYNEQAKCTLSECEKGYKADGNKCVVNEGETCDPAPATKTENGIYKYKDNKGTAECVITGCTSGTLSKRGYCMGDYDGPTQKITGHITGTAEGDTNGIKDAEIYPKDPEYQVTVSRIRTDMNGNFTFDKFPADETEYCVRADSSKYEKKCVSIETTEVQLIEIEDYTYRNLCATKKYSFAERMCYTECNETELKAINARSGLVVFTEQDLNNNTRPSCRAAEQKDCLKNYTFDEESSTCIEDDQDTQNLEKAIDELTTEFQAKISQLQNGEDK